jgi:hypothetical protein
VHRASGSDWADNLEIEQVAPEERPVGQRVQGVFDPVAAKALQAKPTLRRRRTSPSREIAGRDFGKESGVNSPAEKPAPNGIARIAGAVAP